MAQEIKQCVAEIVDEVYEDNNCFTKEDLYNEYISQIEENDYNWMLHYLYKEHRKLWFKIIKLLKGATA